MKVINKITLGLIAATLLLIGCSDSTSPAKNEVIQPIISEDSLGLRKTTLYDENVNPHGTSYSQEYAGTSQKIKRAFQDAPPMIPHNVEGMLPITINDNQCIACHDPLVAESMGATPYPNSHMVNFRPTSSSSAIKGENTSSETQSDVLMTKGDKLVGARFNCTACHAPQDTGALAVPNNFEPDYTSTDGTSKSTWDGTKLMEGINTFESSK